ncbi:hypothetical protein BGZ51_003660 [Haplosporangium sp. Z 767]|nr:hypothetical protein BGZ51_003660 [Haplosporangium sp. Z 767]
MVEQQGRVPGLNERSTSQKAPFKRFNRGRRQSCKRVVDVTRAADRDITRVQDNNGVLQRWKKVQRIFQRSGRRKAAIRTIGIEESVNGTESTLVTTAPMTEPCAYQGNHENGDTVRSSKLPSSSYFSPPLVAIFTHEPLPDPTSEGNPWDEQAGYSGYGHHGSTHTGDMDESSDDSSGITTTATILTRAMPISREISVVHSNIMFDAQLPPTVRSAGAYASCLSTHSIVESDKDRPPFQSSSYSSSDMISSVSVNNSAFSPSFSDSDDMEQDYPRLTAGHPFVHSSEETTQSDLSNSSSANASSVDNSDDDDRNDACSNKEVHHSDGDSVRNQSKNDSEDWTIYFLSIQSAYRNLLASLHHGLCKDLHQRLEQHQRQILDLQRDMIRKPSELSSLLAETVHHSIEPRLEQDRNMQRKCCWLIGRAIMTSLEGSMFNTSFTEDTIDGMGHYEEVGDDPAANRQSSTATQAVPDEEWELFAWNELERPHATILDLHNAQRQEKHIGPSFLGDGASSRHSIDVKKKRDERDSNRSDSTVDSRMREEIMKRVAELDAEAINNANRNKKEEKVDQPQEDRRWSAYSPQQHASSAVSALRLTSPVGFGLQSQSPLSSPGWFFHRNSLDIPRPSSRTTPCRCAATVTKSNGARRTRPVTRPTRSQTAVFTSAKSAAKTLPSAVNDSGTIVINNYFRGGVHYHRQLGHRPTPSRIRLQRERPPLRSMSAIPRRQYERRGCSKHSTQDASDSFPWIPSFRCRLHCKPRSSQTSQGSRIQGNIQKEIKLLDEDDEAGFGYEAGSDTDLKPYTGPNKRTTLSKSQGETDSGAGAGSVNDDLSHAWGISNSDSCERTSLSDPLVPQQHLFPFCLEEGQTGSTTPTVDQFSWIRASHINETMLALEGRLEEAEKVQEARIQFENSISPTETKKKTKKISRNPTEMMQKHLEGKFEFDQWVALHDIRSQNIY